MDVPEQNVLLEEVSGAALLQIDRETVIHHGGAAARCEGGHLSAQVLYLPCRLKVLLPAPDQRRNPSGNLKEPKPHPASAGTVDLNQAAEHLDTVKKYDDIQSNLYHQNSG